MKPKLPVFLHTGMVSVAIAISCGGCFLFHQHSAYRHIHECAKSGDATCVAQELAEHPDELNLRDDGGLTPLHLAAGHCHTNVVALLLDKGARINAKAKGGATPLHLAAQEGCAQAARMLLARGAQVNARDDEGRTPLGRAKKWHQDTLVEILRAHGGGE